MKSGWYLFAASLVLSCMFPQSSWARTAEESAAFDLGLTVMNETVYLLDRASPVAPTLDPIAVALNECEGGGSVGDGECLQQAYAAYDRLLNQLYKLALSENDEQAGKALRVSQRQWLSFQKADYEARMAYGSQEDRRGTVVGWAAGSQRIGAIRVRIAELMFFLGADQE
jgi:uncharacterized protein YecT (DUF1311 family)